MNLDKFLDLLAALLGGVGSIYVLKSVAAFTPSVMERLSRTFLGFSSVQIEALTAQKADSIVGIVFLSVAVVLVVFKSIFRLENVRMFKLRLVGVVVVFGVVGVVLAGLLFWSEGYQREQRHAVGQIITKQELGELFRAGKVRASDVPSLRVYGRTLLGMTVEDFATPRSLVNRLAVEVEMRVPPSLDFSDVEKGAEKQ